MSREESVDAFGDIRTLAIPDSDSESDSELVARYITGYVADKQLEP